MDTEETPEERDKREFKEKIRSLSFGPVPGGSREGRFAFRPGPNMAIDGAVVGERRPDGSVMPYVREGDLVPITAKMRADMGHAKFEQAVREATTSPNAQS